jgi:hypothetical protein
MALRSPVPGVPLVLSATVLFSRMKQRVSSPSLVGFGRR